MTMPTTGELLMAAALLVVAWISERARRKLPPTCHCDEAEQGRKCKACTPPDKKPVSWPHLPRVR